MADIPMPQEIIDFMRARDWGTHHVHWHVVRMWDVMSGEVRAWAQEQGWSRYAIQEGEEENGLEFLAMHRVMIRALVGSFPQHRALFAGWDVPPTDPGDANDPLPNGATDPFNPEMHRAIERLHQRLSSFDGEDALGTYLETTLRPFPSNPTRRASDRSSGIHNYMHNRFADGASQINMGDPSVNIENQRFWRLHGWIDARWSAYRQATGRRDDDRRYVQAMEEAERHMGVRTDHVHLLSRAAAPLSEHHHHHPGQTTRIPDSIKAQILEALYVCDLK